MLHAVAGLMAPVGGGPSEVLFVALILAAFAVVFPLVWLGVVGLLGLLGWEPLVRRFPAGPHPPEGLALTRQSGRIGPVRYRHTLDAVVAAEGLFLRPMRLFSFRHPPMLIPWAVVEAAVPGPFGGVTLHLAGGEAFVVYGRLAEAVLAAPALEVPEVQAPDSEASALEAPDLEAPARRARARSA